MCVFVAGLVSFSYDTRRSLILALFWLTNQSLVMPTRLETTRSQRAIMQQHYLSTHIIYVIVCG